MRGELDRIANQIADRYLGDYLRKFTTRGYVPSQPKQVHDATWGTISLTPLEVALLDSPLLQRLRHLKQLGVAHWVYPSAGHSRFEHTLGVLHQSQQLITAINRSGRVRYNAEIINSKDQITVRLAALLHDIGHPVLSHVSEYAFGLNPKTYVELQRERAAKGEDVKISEHIASAIIRTDVFRKLLVLLLKGHSDNSIPTPLSVATVDETIDKVANCILGAPISHEVPLLHQLISGPFDADKLDYMVRDAQAAGIPTIIDISRLLQKITVKSVGTRQLPKKISKRIPSHIKEVYLFGFTWSGLTVVDELLLARMILYSKLYRHPKVVAIEAMVQVIIGRIASLFSIEQTLALIYGVLDDELVLSSQDDLRRLLPAREYADAESRQSLAAAAELLKRLRERDLFVRAFAFSADYVEAEASQEKDALIRLAERLSNRDEAEAFRLKVVEQLREILTLLKVDIPTTTVIEHFIVLRKVAPPSQEELRRAIIFPSHGGPVTFSDTGIHKDAWSSSFDSASPKGYLVCPRELAIYTYIATEVVVAAEFDVPIPDAVKEQSKQSEAGVREVTLLLKKNGFYKGKPKYLRPLSECLRMADVDAVVEEFGERFATVQESLRDQTEGAHLSTHYDWTRQRAYEWLDQFGSEGNIACAVDLLRRARLLGRGDAVQSIRSFLDINPEFSGASVVGLSQGNESAQIIQYYAADIKSDFKFFSKWRDAMDAEPGRPLLFLDDFCASGGQLKNLIGSWFDEPTLRNDAMNEQRPLVLRPEQDFLRSRKVGFAFVAGWSTGLMEVEKAAHKVGMDARVYARLKDADIPTAFENVDTDIDSSSWGEFRAFCEHAGDQLLSKEPWKIEKRKERVLGYGNRALLLFFPYNSPSQTLTCAWAEGEVDGDLWTPLIRRRKKVL